MAIDNLKQFVDLYMITNEVGLFDQLTKYFSINEELSKEIPKVSAPKRLPTTATMTVFFILFFIMTNKSRLPTRPNKPNTFAIYIFVSTIATTFDREVFTIFCTSHYCFTSNAATPL